MHKPCQPVGFSENNLSGVSPLKRGVSTVKQQWGASIVPSKNFLYSAFQFCHNPPPTFRLSALMTSRPTERTSWTVGAEDNFSARGVHPFSQNAVTARHNRPPSERQNFGRIGLLQFVTAEGRRLKACYTRRMGPQEGVPLFRGRSCLHERFTQNRNTHLPRGRSAGTRGGART